MIDGGCAREFSLLGVVAVTVYLMVYVTHKLDYLSLHSAKHIVLFTTLYSLTFKIMNIIIHR